jgi:hypothetical protein
VRVKFSRRNCNSTDGIAAIAWTGRMLGRYRLAHLLHTSLGTLDRKDEAVWKLNARDGCQGFPCS